MSNDKAYTSRMQVVSCRWILRSSRYEADIETTQSRSLFTANHCHWPCLAKSLTPVEVPYVLEFTSSSGFSYLVIQIVHPSSVCQLKDSIDNRSCDATLGCQVLRYTRNTTRTSKVTLLLWIPTSHLSPLTQSASDDSYSVVSDSDILDTQSEQITANALSQPVSIGKPAAAKGMTELHDALKLEISQLIAERNDALQKAKEHEAAKKTAEESTSEQLCALSKKTGHSIGDVSTLVTNYEESQNFAKTVIEVYYKRQYELYLDKSAEVSKLKRKVINQTESIEKKPATLNNEVIHLQEQVHLGKSETEALRTSCDEIETELGLLRGREAELQIEVDTLKNEKASMWAHADMQHLREQVKRLGDKIEGLNVEVAKLEADKEDRQKELKEDVTEAKLKLHNARCRGRRLKKQRDNARAAKGGSGPASTSMGSDW